MKRAAILVVAAVVLAALIGGFAWFQFVMKPEMVRGFITGAPQPLVTVTAEPARQEQWQTRLPAIGSLRAIRGIDVAPQVSGLVSAIRFESGSTVERGAVLVQIDDSIEQADLKAGQAELRNAELNLSRQRELLGRGNTSKTAFDTAQSNRDVAAATIDRTRALIAQKVIKAPFPGRLGIRVVDLGAYVSPGTTMVTLQQLDPIYADFPIPEQQFDMLRTGQTVEVTVDAYAGVVFKGQIDSIDARVNEETRNVLVRAELANPDRRLLPGMFANVAVVAGDAATVVTVPRTAVTYSLYGDSVYVVGEDGAAAEAGRPIERRFVRTGDTREGRVAITEGIKAGDQVVTSGQLKLHTGSRVRIEQAEILTPPAVRPKE
ncbi:membrane fusion protein (multidrug efflux system) [Constrictibacter sp. MBR-5]|jgi:membrane fusion protein (multidrug efflux system)|uniref:efflux RND transporter periplasmic adaptor subunit n=1 Tax=Constrictibacter sp. MBR-5 TaxID=3156467 RepID=UPI0033999BDD